VLSYQRYAILIFLVAVTLILGVALVSPTSWLAWLVVAPISLKMMLFAREIGGRLKRKLRATTVGLRRIESGSFEPRMVQSYCTDPCFRVVAHTLLRRAGFSTQERRHLIRRYTAELKREQSKTYIFNASQGTTTEIDAQGSRPFVPDLPGTPQPNEQES